jgi:hypothetical protein
MLLKDLHFIDNEKSQRTKHDHQKNRDLKKKKKKELKVDQLQWLVPVILGT